METPTSSSSRWKYALRALEHRNYKLFFGGQSLSMIGTWMTQVATSWLVYRVTGSAWLLGLVGFSGQVPALLLTPFAGVWVDRWNLHRTLKITQALSMAESFALAALALSGRINTWEIIALTAFQGAVNAFDMPARQAFLIEMITDRADLSNAIALNSSMVNGARLIGPSIAGMIIAVAGEGYCFLIDGISYLAVIGSLLLMHIGAPAARRERESVLAELKEGWNYVVTFAPIRAILLLLAAIGLFGVPYSVLLPIFASNILHGGPHTYGFLTGATGVGALISALTLAMRKSIVGLGRVIAASAFVFGASLMAFGGSHWLWFSLLLMLAAGFSMMQIFSACNTILQTIVEEDKRGRVMAFYTMSFLGVAPFGSLVAGALAGKIGAPLTLALGGVLCIVVAGRFTAKLKELAKIVRPIYVELGILPEIAIGIEAAALLQTPPE